MFRFVLTSTSLIALSAMTGFGVASAHDYIGVDSTRAVDRLDPFQATTTPEMEEQKNTIAQLSRLTTVSLQAEKRTAERLAALESGGELENFIAVDVPTFDNDLATALRPRLRPDNVAVQAVAPVRPIRQPVAVSRNLVTLAPTPQITAALATPVAEAQPRRLPKYLIGVFR